MAASHPNMFRKSFVDESEILKLVDDHHLPPPLRHSPVVADDG
jgi:hypothetical protein